ncbi:bidirectional sugar transporter [Musa troglodytarum]|uniref:Bidirectional sugar transporter SWEET n=1 Tax=Musa troglodytarum TaxID=320322 RepID=A0A9E7HN64_9LILI|nr:bidirectional sugar transporter [Musa troglodytarum]
MLPSFFANLLLYTIILCVQIMMFTFHGILLTAARFAGNLISFMVFLAPIPTFYRVYRKKSTEGFHSVPYVVALFSCMLWIYYAFVKTNSMLLITINSFGLLIETIYITIYLIYAPRKARIFCIQMFVLLDLVAFAAIVLTTQLLFKGSSRVTVLGWICVGFSISVFAAPLSVIRLVIRTKSVEFMPFYLSFFLTLSAIAWFGYGLFTKDIYVQLPNVLGFVFGIAQMLLYIIYKKKKNVVVEPTVPEHVLKIAELLATPASELQVGIEETGRKKKATADGEGGGNGKAAAAEEGIEIDAV